MAKVLKEIFTGADKVQQTFTINSWHVSQSVDALTGAEDYDITISGSLTVTGSILHAEIQNANGVASSVLVRDDSTGEYYITGSYGGGGATDTGSLLVTASVTDNDITFEKGDGTTFTITVDTGSASGDNLYNIDGTLTNNRVVTANANDLTFEFETANFIINSDNAQRVTIANLPTSDQPQVVGIDSSGTLKAMNTSSIAGGSTDTGSLLVTSSASNNVITFEKGDGSTYTITVDTGSGGGGSTDYVSNVAYDTGSIDFTGVGSAFNGVININDLTASLISNDQTSSFVTNDQTSSFVTNDETGSFLYSGSYDSSTNLITLYSEDEDYDLDLSGLAGGGGGLAITASYTGSVLTDNARSFDFTGNAVNATNSGNAVTVTIDTGSAENIYSTDGTLTGNRVVTANTNDLTFEFETANFIINSDPVQRVTIANLPTSDQPQVVGIDSSGTLKAMNTSSIAGGTTDTGSLLTTSSVSNNVITFEKGDGSTYTITVDTGSTDYISNVTWDNANKDLLFTGEGSAFNGTASLDQLADNQGGFTFRYSGSTIVGVSSWPFDNGDGSGAGQPNKVVSTAATTLTSSGTYEWHFSDIGKNFSQQFHNENYKNVFSLLTGSIQNDGDVLVRVYDDLNPRYSAYYTNVGTASITNINTGGDLTMDLTFVGGTNFGQTEGIAFTFPNGTNPNHTNVSFEILGSGGGDTTNTGSLLTTGSVSSNVLTFTKGDGSTFTLTVDTGSGGGGTTIYTGDGTITGDRTITMGNGAGNFVITGSAANDGLFGTFQVYTNEIIFPEITLSNTPTDSANVITYGSNGRLFYTSSNSIGGEPTTTTDTETLDDDQIIYDLTKNFTDLTVNINSSDDEITFRNNGLSLGEVVTVQVTVNEQTSGNLDTKYQRGGNIQSTPGLDTTLLNGDIVVYSFVVRGTTALHLLSKDQIST